MIQPVSSTLSIAPTTRNRDASSPARFARSLAVVQAAGGGKDTPDDAAASPIDDGKPRQDAADDGSDLPKGDAPIDPRLAWLTLPGAVPVAVPLPVANLGAPGAAPVPVAAAMPPATPAPLASQTASGAPVTVPPPAPPVDPTIAPTATPAMPAATADAAHPAAPSPSPMAADAPANLKTDAPAITTAPLPIALPDPGRQAIATPALQAFAGAIHAGLKREETAHDTADPLAAPGMTTLAPMETVRHAVTAAGGAQEQTLDTRREHWPATMIDHIESLRDAADANSSRIRVMPDALGTIDLSVKRDGDTLHVHFNADQAATRTMLADAQPQLAEIAQSRGLRLGDTNVSGGGASGQQQPQQRQQRQPAQAAPTQSTPAPATIAAAIDDTRIG